MKFTLAACLALAGFAAAKEVNSKQFKLVVESPDKSLNGKELGACHTGAAIESLCLNVKGVPFKFRYDTEYTPAAKGLTPDGFIVYDLPTSMYPSSLIVALQNPQTDKIFAGPKVTPSAMEFNIDPSTNVALPLLFPGYDYPRQYVSFNQNGHLKIVSYLDDTKKTPPTSDKARVLSNWHICNTKYGGYSYKTLAWVLGNQKPQNPSCKKVSIRRKFI
jgi:hypothetical protein